jgi:hypothetical protein
MNKNKRQKKQVDESSSDESEISNSIQNENEDQDEQEQEENLVEQKEEVYKKIKSKLEILDIIFHPSNDNLIYLGLINGKLKM